MKIATLLMLGTSTLSLAAVVGAGCGSRGTALVASPGTTVAHGEAPSADDADAPECPGPYFAVSVRGRNTTDIVVKHEVEIAADISRVPEFHDCQRFIEAGRYGALYAVFAADSLDTPHTTFAGDPTAVAEVYTRRGDYPRLGIRRGFNCVYVTSDSGWQAFMVRAGDNDEECTPRLGELRGSAVKLPVSRVQVPGMAEDDYPAVARWDRDRDGYYFIGVKCGAAWCEIGLRHPAGSSTPLAVRTDMDAGQHRVRLIKGWYDQQALAIPDGMTVKPQAIVATVIPHPDLGEATFAIGSSLTDDNWTPVASIEMGHIPQYTSKLGLRSGTNQVLLRRIGEHAWQARIVAQNGATRDLKVKRFGHEGANFKIPGTVRWRWLAKDETIWVRCLEGCCQVQQTVPATGPSASADST